ncbi:MAG: ABC transporter permease [Candidatus Thorarchaeota archaeon]|nr:ABC transporter permease [Candidatus Thorarchaeota archaeon]
MGTRRISALVKKNLKMFTRQPAVLFLLLLFPLIVTATFGLAFGGMGEGGTSSFDIGLLNLDTAATDAQWAESFEGNLTELDGVTVHYYYDNETGHSELIQGNLDAFIVIPQGFGDSCISYWESPLNGSSWTNTTVELYVDSGSMIASSAVPPLVRQVMLNTLFGNEATTLDLPVDIGSPSMVEASTLSQWDFMAPGIFAFASIFMIMIVAQSLTEERDGGLLKRMGTTPLKSHEFMLSQVISYMIIAVIQVVLVFLTSYMIGYRPATDAAGIAFAFSMLLAFSLVNVGFGLVAATVSKSAEIATGVSFIFIMPQMFLGTFMPLGGAAEVIAQFMPSNYVTESLTTLFLRGAPIATSSIWMNLAVVSVIGIAVLLVGILLFRKYGTT